MFAQYTEEKAAQDHNSNCKIPIQLYIKAHWRQWDFDYVLCMSVQETTQEKKRYIISSYNIYYDILCYNLVELTTGCMEIVTVLVVL